ncbi:hypothetical protein C8R43DRAFT_1106924 [Mycena crocata]|nr:hypothetical protein C8R43DRAFT_1106924 [Mycena crocata]
MTIRFLDLPSEILIIILNSLDLPTLSRCLSINRRLKCPVDDSSLLQYRQASLAACIEDNPCNVTTSSAQRLDALQKRQRSFAKLLPSFTYPIPMDDFPIVSGYALSGGLFAMLELDGKSLRFMALPKRQEQTPSWDRLVLDESILEFALAVPEDNLLAVLTSTETPPNIHLTPDASLTLRFFETSTLSVHPKARESVLHVPCDVADLRVRDFHLDICGSKVALLMESVLLHHPTPNHLLIYDWNTGRLEMELTGHYSAAVFLSHDIILLARTETGELELWAIPDSPLRIAARPEISLKLPRLKSGGKYYPGKVESNPKGSQWPTSQQPFHSSFADSIMALKFEIEIQGGAGHLGDADMMLVIPKRALLQQLPPTGERSADAPERAWVEWGPHISRWLVSDMFAGIWPTIICGQRCVVRDSFVSGSVVVFDFNPYTYRRMLLQNPEAVMNETTPAKQAIQIVPASRNQFLEMDVFDEEVDSLLGYVATRSLQEDWYDGVLMDEECLVGIRDDTDSKGTFALDVWHFG